MTGKRTRIRRKTRAQLDRLWEHAKRTWIQVNETLKNGKWNSRGEEKQNEE